MVGAPLASYTKSELRKPEVVKQAFQGPVEIVVGGGADPLLLMSRALVEAHAELQRLTEVFVRMVVELQRDDPSAVVLGEVGYIAAWSPEDRQRFVAGFAEALATSLRAGDPRAARGYISLMETAGHSTARRDLTGEVSGRARAAVADRLRT